MMIDNRSGVVGFQVGMIMEIMVWDDWGIQRHWYRVPAVNICLT